MQNNAIDINCLYKGFKGQNVLKGVSLAVKRGEYFGLVGMNGAGKTTLIKSLLDFCQIDKGKIQIFDTEHRLTAARQRLAYLPERFNPPFYLTGREFMRYMSELHGVAYDRGEVERIFHHLDLDMAALSRPVRAYSKGMAQKLGLATCFLSQRDLLILDEPMSGLDPKARALFKDYLADAKTRGQTLFFTTHLLNDVESLCDRLAILHNGEMRFVGSPTDCCRHYTADNLEHAYLTAIETDDAHDNVA
ncbi:ABC transporter, ATP-binding protein [hydrothermal vent metagenome]|uniref:ABC transporter, ATP-binding protein n=1 Tax=hydrothermal vent metagenome TaxID=652676 RepID=A0A3B0YK81_9ZZZZ